MKDNSGLSIKLGEYTDKLLFSKVNKYLKNTRISLNAETICSYYYENNYLEISFENGRCSYDKQGTCTMCDYGVATEKQDVSIFIKEMLRIYDLFPKVDSLMLCTNGSFLDDKQIPLDFQKVIMKVANNLPCKKIYIETHYSTITDSKLKLLKDIFKNKTVKIELGLETINSFYQEYILNKKIPIQHLKSIIKKIQDCGYIPIINLLLGLPFLNEKEQVEDILNSVDWCIENQTDMVLFPINIKPHTLIYYLYQNGMYSPISQWEMIYVLSLIDETYLSKIDIAYWGNRDESGDNEMIIFPSFCPKCRPLIYDFYTKYLSTDNSKDRKRFINDLFEKADCNCFQLFQNKLMTNGSDIKKRIEKAYTRLAIEFKERI